MVLNFRSVIIKFLYVYLTKSTKHVIGFATEASCAHCFTGHHLPWRVEQWAQSQGQREGQVSHLSSSQPLLSPMGEEHILHDGGGDPPTTLHHSAIPRRKAGSPGECLHGKVGLVGGKGSGRVLETGIKEMAEICNLRKEQLRGRRPKKGGVAEKVERGEGGGLGKRVGGGAVTLR